jgi:hypothetical protein
MGLNYMKNLWQVMLVNFLTSWWRWVCDEIHTLRGLSWNWSRKWPLVVLWKLQGSSFSYGWGWRLSTKRGQFKGLVPNLWRLASEMETPYCVERRILWWDWWRSYPSSGLEFAPQVLKLPCVPMSNPLSLHWTSCHYCWWFVWLLVATK